TRLPRRGSAVYTRFGIGVEASRVRLRLPARRSSDPNDPESAGRAMSHRRRAPDVRRAGRSPGPVLRRGGCDARGGRVVSRSRSRSMTDSVGERAAFLKRVQTGAVVPVARAFVCDSLTPVTLLSRMRESGAECFLLESVAGGESLARYTFLGCAPVARLMIEQGRVWEERGGHRTPLHMEPLRALERLVTPGRFIPDPDLPPLSAG